MRSTEKEAQESLRRMTELRESIRRSFPEVQYTGKITPHDGEWLPELSEENAILDDDKVLYEALSRRRWTEIPVRVFEDLPDGLSLLTDEAFVAFVPAWLFRSLDDIDGENEVRSFLIYTFSPRPEMVPDLTSFITHRLRILNPHQRITIRSLMSEFVQREKSPFLKTLAARAVTLIDSLRNE